MLKYRKLPKLLSLGSNVPSASVLLLFTGLVNSYSTSLDVTSSGKASLMLCPFPQAELLLQPLSVIIQAQAVPHTGLKPGQNGDCAQSSCRPWVLVQSQEQITV